MKIFEGRFWSSAGLFAKCSLVSACLYCAGPSFGGQTALIDTGAIWRFLDDGADHGLDWADFWQDDSAWQAGPSPLGFGESFIATQTRPRIVTTYFRYTFNVADPSAISDLTLWVLRDDGVRIFLNGIEVFRNNLPPGEINYLTRAPAVVEAAGYIEGAIDPFWLNSGPNVLAAEVHQSDVNSSDLVLDVKLFARGDIPDTRDVAITAPADGTMFRRGSDVPIGAVVTGATNPISSVQFYADTTLLAEDAAAPYEMVWSNVQIGTYQLSAVAVPAQGLSFTSAPVRIVIISNLPPRGQITSPANNSTLPVGDITIEAAAQDDDGSVVRAEFYANGTKIGEDISPPFSMLWSNVSAGRYILSAGFTDNEGGQGAADEVPIQVVAAAGVVRGPYLQVGTPHSVIVRWRTDAMFDSVVRYGVDPDELTNVASVAALTTEHQVSLSGLAPDTKYYYSVGHSKGTLAGDGSYFFVTAPVRPKPTRVWVIGDSGTELARMVYDAYSGFTGSRYTDLWLILGDNAYDSGTDLQYQLYFFNMYPEILRQTVLWPTPGNHEVSPAYWDSFTLPANGEAGGVASGTQHYYSFNYGNIHFISLDGYWARSRLSNGPMCNWLKADLEANTNEWLIAFWHEPPYSHGSHNSDLEGDLIEMRENAVPILESYGVDLVLCGHSHVYERSYLLHGHYGYSDSLTPEMMLDKGSGREEDSGAYTKMTYGLKANEGTVYVVAGSSGHATFFWTDYLHCMYKSLLQMGSVVLDIDGGTLQAKFLRETGEVDDYFTLQKISGMARITSFRLNEGIAAIRWRSTPGRKYQLQFTTDLGLEPWRAAGPPIIANSNETGTSQVVPSGTRGFYRVAAVN